MILPEPGSLEVLGLCALAVTAALLLRHPVQRQPLQPPRPRCAAAVTAQASVLAVTAFFSDRGGSAPVTVVIRTPGGERIEVTQTARATAYQATSGYCSDTLFFDLARAAWYELHVGDPEAGTVLTNAWTTH